MGHDKPRYDVARKAAVHLLIKSGVTEPPVPLERIAKDLGLVVRYEPLEGDLSAVLVRRGDVPVVGINSMHPTARQRFSLAHEIGHFLLHKAKDVFVDRQYPVHFRDAVSSTATDPEEVEANQFAASLTMPEAMLKRDVEGSQLDIESETAIADLAKRYGVSKQALAIRIGAIYKL